MLGWLPWSVPTGADEGGLPAGGDPMSRNNRVSCLIGAGLVLGAALLASPDQAAAQARWGFLGGANFATMGQDMEQMGDDLATELEFLLGGDWSASKTSSTGLALGAYYVLPASPTLGVQFEGQYVQRGVGFDFANGAETADTAFKLDYIEIPILLRMSPNPAGKARAVFLVGPVIGFKVGADFEASGAGGSNSVDVGDGFSATTFGAVGGIGLDLRTGTSSSLMLQGRYYLGLANALDDEVYTSKSGDFGVYLGMEFALGQ